jgi:hypothetical protein
MASVLGDRPNRQTQEELPMKFIVATYGTEGDARPFAALCRGLMDAGHEAQLLADAATLGSAQSLGVPTTALAGDIRGTLGADRAIAGVVAKGGGFDATARALRIRRVSKVPRGDIIRLAKLRCRQA